MRYHKKNTIMLLVSCGIMLFTSACAKQTENSDKEVSVEKQLTDKESIALLNSCEYFFSDLNEDVLDAFEYWENHDFTGIETITEFEGLWNEIYEKLNEKYSEFNVDTFSDSYKEKGRAVTDSLLAIKNQTKNLCDLDANGDGVYTGEECANEIRAFQDVYVKQVTIILNAIDIDNKQENDSSSDDDKDNEESYNKDSANNTNKDSDSNGVISSGHKCDECGRSAKNDFENPLSGEIEYYCDTHYKDIMDVYDMMETDVGKSENSKHTCYASGCSKEGTNSLMGLNGTYEYYCTEHYKEMEDILEMMLE